MVPPVRCTSPASLRAPLERTGDAGQLPDHVDQIGIITAWDPPAMLTTVPGATSAKPAAMLAATTSDT
jgi:hypothetical protein